MIKNYLRQIREDRMISKSELAQKAGLSVLTIDRIERGYHCRHATKRKILEALEIPIEERHKVFPVSPDDTSEDEDLEAEDGSNGGE